MAAIRLHMTATGQPLKLTALEECPVSQVKGTFGLLPGSARRRHRADTSDAHTVAARLIEWPTLLRCSTIGLR